MIAGILFFALIAASVLATIAAFINPLLVCPAFFVGGMAGAGFGAWRCYVTSRPSRSN